MKIDLSKLDTQKVQFYVKVGDALLHAGAAKLADLRKAAADNGADDEQLARLDALYGDRIAHEQDIVNGKGQ